MKMRYCDPIILHLLDIVYFMEVMLEQSHEVPIYMIHCPLRYKADKWGFYFHT